MQYRIRFLCIPNQVGFDMFHRVRLLRTYRWTKPGIVAAELFDSRSSSQSTLEMENS